ncbi:hypothetical protein GRF29_44g509124 [Pseudopithomyces chartarum]|uniref:Uncharacterized protein n=1 Tax=Pseudopithomyces chartarum TaxID=1892770 RepID=A0AAN6M0Q6_9PLEO|nr:hypothetical protein GRF29_44g509124 [Pseudopithomyces chartarum]
MTSGKCAPFWNSQQLQRWDQATSPSSIALMATFRDRLNIRNFYLGVIEQLIQSHIAVFWIIQPKDSDEPKHDIFEVVKSLVAQSLSKVPAQHTDVGFASRVRAFNSATTVAEYTSLLAEILSGYQLAYVIVDVNSIASDMTEDTREILWKVSEMLRERSQKTVLKVMFSFDESNNSTHQILHHFNIIAIKIMRRSLHHPTIDLIHHTTPLLNIPRPHPQRSLLIHPLRNIRILTPPQKHHLRPLRHLPKRPPQPLLRKIRTKIIIISPHRQQTMRPIRRTRTFKHLQNPIPLLRQNNIPIPPLHHLPRQPDSLLQTPRQLFIPLNNRIPPLPIAHPRLQNPPLNPPSILPLPNKILHNILTPRRVSHNHYLPPRPLGSEIRNAFPQLGRVPGETTCAPAVEGRGEEDFGEGPGGGEGCGESGRVADA